MYCVVYGGYYYCLRIMFSWQDGDFNVVDLIDGRIFVYLVVWKGNFNCFKLFLRNGGDFYLFDKCDKRLVDLI